MKTSKILIMICTACMLLLVGCTKNEVLLDDPWNNGTTDEQIERYSRQIEEVANNIENDDIANVIADVLKAKDVKRVSAQIVYYEGGHSSRVFDNIPEHNLLVKEDIGDSEIFRYIPEHDLFGKEYVIDYEILRYIPMGRRYIIFEYVFVEEQTLRKVVLIIEIEEDDSIKTPYHLYAIDIKAESVYRGEGIPRTGSFGVIDYEYGRLPDIKEER